MEKGFEMLLDGHESKASPSQNPAELKVYSAQRSAFSSITQEERFKLVMYFQLVLVLEM